MDLDYDSFCNEFEEIHCIRTRENTKRETLIRIGIWREQHVAIKNCREREATIYNKIPEHPHIIRLLGIFRVHLPEKNKIQLYILMEANSGITLADTAIFSRYTLQDVLRIMIQITKGLQHLHSCNIIHHDIKRSNILIMKSITKEQEAKICDFGLSCFTDVDGRSSNKSRVSGTKGYLAPEKSNTSDLAITNKVDIFALGVLGTELIDEDEPITTTVNKYNNILNRCKDINPNNRYNATELLAALETLAALEILKEAERALIQ